MIVFSTIYIILTIIIALLVGAFLYLVVYPWILDRYRTYKIKLALKSTGKSLRKLSKNKPSAIQEELERLAKECDTIIKEE